MNIKKLNETLKSLTEDFEVYSPSEEASGNVHRGKFNAKQIRNIMMSYFMYKDTDDILKSIREYIDKMPDSWVLEFLNNQGDTVAKEIK